MCCIEQEEAPKEKERWSERQQERKSDRERRGGGEGVEVGAVVR